MNAANLLSALDRAGFETIRTLLGVLWQSSILLGAAAVLAVTLRRRGASVRHVLWTAALLAVPALPLLGWGLAGARAPRAEIPVMSAYAAPDATPAPPVPIAPAPPPTDAAAPAIAPATPKPQPAPPAPVAPAPRASILSFPWALALLAYVSGAAGLVGLVVVGRLRVHRWLRAGVAVADPRALAAFRAAADRLNAGDGFDVVESPCVRSPLTVGLWRPIVLLPAGFAATLSAADLRAVALHELAHGRRRDPLTLSVLSFLRAVLFFHPLVWLACRQVSRLAEDACDDAVLAATRRGVSYARLLARLAEALPRRASAAELAAGIVPAKSALLRRIEAILSDRRDRARRLSRRALAATVVAAVAFVGVALALPLGEKDAGRADEAAKWTRRELVKGHGVVVRVAVRPRTGPADADWLRLEIENTGREPVRVTSAGYYINYQSFHRATGKAASSGNLASGNSYDMFPKAWRTKPVSPILLKPGTHVLADQPSSYSTALLGMPPKGGWRVKAKVNVSLALAGGRRLTTPAGGVEVSFDWLHPDAAGLEAMRARLRALLAAPVNRPYHAYILGALLKVPEVRQAPSVRELLAATAKRKGPFDGRDSLAAHLSGHFADSPAVAAFYLSALHRMDWRAVEDLAGPAPAIWDDRFVEPLVAMSQAAGESYPKHRGVLTVLGRHHARWKGDASVARRTFAAVHRSFRGVLVPPGTLEETQQAYWRVVVQLVGMTRSREAIALLRPFLDAKTVVGGRGLSAYSPRGGKPIPIRACDAAHDAIQTALGRPDRKLVTPAPGWGRPKAADVQEEFARRDERIAALKAELASRGKAAAPGDNPRAVASHQTVRIGFVGEVRSVGMLSKYSGRVIPVHVDARWVVVVRVEKVDRAKGPIQAGRDVGFAVHSPTKLFAADVRDVLDTKRRFGVTWHTGPPARFTQLVCEPLPAQPAKLPGRELSDLPKLAVSQPVAMVCRATTDAHLEDLGSGLWATVQEYEPIERVTRLHLAEKFKVVYLVRPGQRAVRRGERVVWLLDSPAGGAFRGVKACADTPANRKAVLAAATKAGGNRDPAALLRPKAALLPGSRIALERAVAEATIVAVCRATGQDVAISDEDGVLEHTHVFEVLQVISGQAKPGKVTVHYTQFELSVLSLGRERTIKAGEVVLWIAGKGRRPGTWRGVKALRDTAANRRTVMALAPGRAATRPAAVDSGEKEVDRQIGLLKSRDQRQRAGAAEALGKVGPAARKAVPTLIQLLKNKKEEMWVRARAATALGRIGPAAKEAVPALMEAFKAGAPVWVDPGSGHLPSCAGHALSSIGPAAVKPLMEALKDQRSLVRWNAAEILAVIKPRPISRLIAALEAEDCLQRGAAARALGSMGPAAGKAAAALIEASKGQDRALRGEAVKALGRIGPASPGVVPALARSLEDEDASVRTVGAEALAGIGPAAKEAMPALVQGLKGKSTKMRVRCAEALGRIGPAAKDAVGPLILLLRDDNSDVRSEGARALGRIGPAAGQAAPAVVEALGDTNAWVRWCAAEALVHIAPAATVQQTTAALAELLKDERGWMRVNAAEALGRLGPAAAQAVPGLVRALKDTSRPVREAAATALKRIQPAGPATQPAGQWGEPYQGVSARIVMDRRTFALGEPMPATLELKKVADDARLHGTYGLRNIALSHGGMYRGKEGKGLEAKNVPTGAVFFRAALDLGRDFGFVPRINTDYQIDLSYKMNGSRGPHSGEVTVRVVVPREKVLDYYMSELLADRPREHMRNRGDLLVRYPTDELVRLGAPAVRRLAALLVPSQAAAVREKAGGVLVAFGPQAKPALPELIEAVKDDNQFVRRHALRALGNIGPGAKKALPAVTEALKDAEPRVREAAAEALKRIRAGNGAAATATASGSAFWGVKALRDTPANRRAAAGLRKPRATPAALDLDATARLLAKALGGTWQKGLHSGLHISKRILRGEIRSAAGKLLVRYNVFPFGAADADQQRWLAKVCVDTANGRILGASDLYTVLELASDPAAAAARRQAVTRALRLKPVAARGARTSEAGASWGQPEDGLRCRLTTDKAAVPLGAVVRFHLHFRFDPTGVRPEVALLNRCDRAWRATLTLRDTKTGKVLRRAPFDVHMPPVGPRPQDIERLRGGKLRADTLKVHLLSDAGEQVPPGTYAVTAAYENTAKPDVEVYTAPDGSVRTRPHRGPGKFWKGRIVSAPALLTVTKAEAQEINLKTNSAFLVKATKDGIGWTWSGSSPLRVRAKRRPGYVIGRRHSLHVLLDGKDLGERGGGMGNSAWQDEGQGMTFLPPKVVDRVRAGARLKLRADVEIFETSVPVRHMWAPKSGDYKVLWKGRIEGVLPAGEAARLVTVPTRRWGRPVDGLQTKLALVGGGRPGEIEAFLQFRNVSGEPIEIARINEPLRFLRVLRDGKHRVAAKERPRPRRPEPGISFIEGGSLTAGSWTEGLSLRLERAYDLTTPGLYGFRWSVTPDKLNVPGRVPPPSAVAYLRVPAGKGAAPRLTSPFAEALAALTRRAIALPVVEVRGREGDQNTTGLDLSRLLALTGQNGDLAAFTRDHRHFRRDVDRWERARKTWALCSLLDHDNVDAKIHAARSLASLADPASAVVLYAAAKRNHYSVEGSENATLHSIYRQTLKRALEKTTGLSLTPKGLRVTVHRKGEPPKVIRSEDQPSHFKEEIDFAKVEQWLREAFLGKRPTEKPAAKPAAAAAWGEEAEGLRCRWLPPGGPIVTGTAPTVTMEVENVSTKPVLWHCASEGTMVLSVSGVSDGRFPSLVVRPGQGVRPATAGELRAANIVWHPMPQRDDAVMPGYYRLAPRGRVSLLCKLPFALKRPGTYRLNAWLYRVPYIWIASGPAYPGQKTEIRCPPLVVQVGAGRPAPKAGRPRRLSTAPNLPLVPSV